jgi:hypothetical protein
VWLAFASPAGATTAVSNLSEPKADSLRIISQGPGFEAFGASSFTLDGSDYVLDSVTLALQFQASDPHDGGFFVEIRDDAGGNPGALVTNGALTGPSNPLTDSATYTATGLVLSADTTYWVVAGVDVGGGWYRWDMTTSNNEAGTWVIGDQSGRRSNDRGVSWSQLSTETGLAVNMFSIDATLVPEPPPDLVSLLAGLLSDPPTVGGMTISTEAGGDMTGPNQMANEGRLGAFINRLLAAQDLAGVDLIAACEELASAEKKVDPNEKNPWFAGPVADELLWQIQTIEGDLGCP